MEELAVEEAKLGQLHAETRNVMTRIAALRSQIDNSGGSPALEQHKGTPNPSVISPALCKSDKIALFRSLFRGREDVFPRRWENVKTGKAGYSPVCGNEWKRGDCEKAAGRGKGHGPLCGDCPKQAFLPVTDREVEKHLRGEHVMGVYPLLHDESCWFLALDFDKKAWKSDIEVFLNTCRTFGLSPAVERSRSGDGAHIWLFFSTPIKAAEARKLGCLLITETMARRHQLSMESYDRLFPNQDTMPKGGFGNLIALPLQREARQLGNTVFLDEAFEPWPDQWAFLSKIQSIAPDVVCHLAEEATRRGTVIGLRTPDAAGEDNADPWNSPSKPASKQKILAVSLPPTVQAFLAQRLFLEKAGLPSILLNQLKRLAAFQNPEFYKKQRLRLSTALTPRVIACAEELPDHIALPRGCLPTAEAFLQENGIKLLLVDKREPGSPVSCTFHGRLTPVQEQAAMALLGHDTGVLVAPPGTGKTVIGAYLIAERKTSTLVLVHRRPLLSQWVAQLALFLDRDPKTIGQIGAGRNKPNGSLDVVMIQSLVRRGSVREEVAGYGQIILDEAHHCPALSFEQVLSTAKARYIVGLTATPKRLDGHHPIMEMQLGPVRFHLRPQSQDARQPFAHHLIVRQTAFCHAKADVGIHELYAALGADEKRNDMIFDDIIQALEEKRSPLVLTERRDHLEHFAARLQKFARHLIVLHGGMKAKDRRDTMARLASIPKGEERVLLATGRFIGEGFDDARLDTLFLALPVSWKGTLVQYAGRLHRLYPGKTEVRIYDYLDSDVPMLAKMFEKRLRGYRALGYHHGRASEEEKQQEK